MVFSTVPHMTAAAIQILSFHRKLNRGVIRAFLTLRPDLHDEDS